MTQGGGAQRPRRQNHHQRVPTTAQVVPGVAVNVVLKEDQPTGRTVAGTVRDVLTRGNHPRGIKVRLADGRVGRVQSLASSTPLPASAPAMQNSGDDDGCGAAAATIGGAFGGLSDTPSGSSWVVRREGVQGGARRGLVRDTRLDEEELPAEQIGLDAYIKQAKPKDRRKGKGKGGGDASAGDGLDGTPPASQPAADEAGTPTLARCPVCDVFEGDEAAVAHHVAGHFDS